ncbi:MAG: Crp/Fnr family transcriptional regulator [Chloroflexi bacterium]|nr:Crp/Fnr family transcriptional regulator [Chloroflexota bacterium]
MISPELIRRYPFFAGLTEDNLLTLANAGEDMTVEAGYVFFREGDELHHIYIVVEGAIGIVVEAPAQNVEHSLSDQLTRTYQTEEVVVSAVGPGEVFGWSGLVPPHQAVAGAKALAASRVIAFDCDELKEAFQKDCRFGFLMMQRVAQVIRERLRALRIESLARVMAV